MIFFFFFWSLQNKKRRGEQKEGRFILETDEVVVVPHRVMGHVNVHVHIGPVLWRHVFATGALPHPGAAPHHLLLLLLSPSGGSQ